MSSRGGGRSRNSSSQRGGSFGAGGGRRGRGTHTGAGSTRGGGGRGRGRSTGGVPTRRGGGGDSNAPPPSVSTQIPPVVSEIGSTSSSSTAVSSLTRGDVENRLTVSPPPWISTQLPPVVYEIGSTSSSISSLTRDEENLLMVSPAPTQGISTSTLPLVSSKSSRLPARSGFGMVGRNCVVRANHFLIDIPKIADKDLHHYDVSITPEVKSRGVNRAILKQLIKTYGESHLARYEPAYDGRKTMYTAGPLPFTSKDFVIKLDVKDGSTSTRKEREFKVAIKFAAKLDLHRLKQFLCGTQMDDAPQEVIQCLDVVLRESPSNNYTIAGRSFFSPKFGQISNIGNGVECWRGYYQSLRPTQMGLSLNIDLAATSFYGSMNVVNFVVQFLNLRDKTRPLSDQDRVKVKMVLKGVKVELTHLNGIVRKRILGITSKPTSELKFLNDKKGTKMSVVKYFKETYGIKLQRHNWPALQSGTDARPVYLPMELCKIVEGQKYLKKLIDQQVTGILEAACQPPNKRKEDIVEIVGHNDYHNDTYVKEFGIIVENRLALIDDARILPAPKLKYHNDMGWEVEVQPSMGKWSMSKKKFIHGGSVDYWACVNFSQMNSEQQAINFFKKLVGMCGSKGMAFNPNPLLPMVSARPDQIENTLIKLHTDSVSKLANKGVNGKQLQFLMIILPDSKGPYYGKIKRICETVLGIVSQCCVPQNVELINNHPIKSRQILENISLKINVKVGGRNTILNDPILERIPATSDEPNVHTIIFGADVTHPQPGDDCSPSIAAVVASMDWPGVAKYRCLVATQPHRQETIEDLFKEVDDPQKGKTYGGMIRELLIAFEISTGHKPRRIIFYRDGVGEGQFAQVLLQEVDAIHKACASLKKGYRPYVTFVVVQKRHHTRLFCANHDDRNTMDMSGNISPGTVVDTKICHPTEFDFYLCSHAGIKGTSRPAHYHVLYDDNRFTADELQELTNNLCYTYARCTRSVSIVPPVYYAHLGAFRARYYIEGDISNTSGSSTTSAGGIGNTREENAAILALPQVKDCVKDVMFFC